MFKKGIVMMFAALLCAPAVFAAPEEMTGKTDLTVDGFADIYKDSSQDAALNLMYRLAYNVNDNFAVGVESGYYFDSKSSIGGINLGDLNGIPLFGDLIVRFPNQSSVEPYGVLALGAIFWNFDESSLVKSAGVTASVDTGFAAKLAGGVDWFMNDHWAVNVEGGYIFSNATATVSGGGASISDKSDMDHWVVGGGLKYVF